MRLIPLLCIFVLIFSCSIKKRSYRKGYYIDWALSKQSKKSSSAASLYPPPVSDNEEAEEEHVLASAENKPLIKISQPLTITFDESCGDSIFFRKGSPVKAKVLELNEKQIKYKRCDNFDGPTIIVNKSSVDYIKYGSGMIEKFDPAPIVQETNVASQPQKKEIANKKKKIHPLVWWAFACSILSLAPLFGILFLIAGFILSPMAHRRIRENPDKYKGLDLLGAGTVIRWFTVALYVLVIAILIAIG